MIPTLCQTFRLLAFRTFDQLGRARRVEHQPLEETFTDTNILDLKERHPTEIYSRVYNKRDEGKSGADWEWWLTNWSMTNWLGLRVQAKILNLELDAFSHLHYKSGKSKEYQSTKLKRESAKEGLIPLYCFYVHEEPVSQGGQRWCGSFGYSPEYYGCSLASISHIETLRTARKDDRESVMQKTIPWHCLVCCRGYEGDDLPNRAWLLLQHRLKIAAPLIRTRDNQQAFQGKPIGPRPQAPDYVRSVIENRRPDGIPTNSRGVLVLRALQYD
ncbi:hypothetical protein SAMN05216404_11329 [Nitrosospira multiformis]|uniref:Uncharacterized protein n=1 Tax=Nitrosospira multiformis TaxID=1231 RepID=A0A1H8MLG6_9PROT|nr:hypothetical protein SAMN05216404_11329 [Nitrosospira multiformis]